MLVQTRPFIPRTDTPLLISTPTTFLASSRVIYKLGRGSFRSLLLYLYLFYPARLPLWPYIHDQFVHILLGRVVLLTSGWHGI